MGRKMEWAKGIMSGLSEKAEGCQLTERDQMMALGRLASHYLKTHQVEKDGDLLDVVPGPQIK
jgi:hypothetical protein